jgi:four helix bundle protein
MAKAASDKQYDLEERTFEFAKQVRAFVKKLPRNITNTEDVKQVTRSSGSVGANYIEANESLGKKDFRMHVKIARKEAKETIYWLGLLDTGSGDRSDEERKRLINEAKELMSIMGAILRNSS